MSTAAQVPVDPDPDPDPDLAGGAPLPASPVVRGVTVVAVVVVAVIAAMVSYSHMQQLAQDAGEGWRSWLIPLSIDGLVVAASMVLVTRRRSGLGGGYLAWGALGVGVLASLAANMADARPELTAVLVAGWPALAFAVAFELLLQQRRAEQAQPTKPAAPPPAATHVPEPLPAATYLRVEPVPSAWAPPPPPQAQAREADATPIEAPTPRPVPDLDEPAEVTDPDPSPGRGDDDLVTRVRQVIEDSTAAGARPPGRRAIAKQLQASEHQVRVALGLVGATTGPALDGAGAEAQRVGAGQGGQ